MADWKVSEQMRLDKEREQRIKDGDGGGFIKIEEGVTTVSVDLKDEPKITETKYGKRRVIYTIDPAGKHIEMSDALYQAFIKGIQGHDGVVKLNFIRTGKDKINTKYIVKVV